MTPGSLAMRNLESSLSSSVRGSISGPWPGPVLITRRGSAGEHQRILTRLGGPRRGTHHIRGRSNGRSSPYSRRSQIKTTASSCSCLPFINVRLRMVVAMGLTLLLVLGTHSMDSRTLPESAQTAGRCWAPSGCWCLSFSRGGRRPWRIRAGR